jgi:hypothetical protein
MCRRLGRPGWCVQAATSRSPPDRTKSAESLARAARIRSAPPPKGPCWLAPSAEWRVVAMHLHGLRPHPWPPGAEAGRSPHHGAFTTPGDGPESVGVTAGAEVRLARSARPDARRPVVVQDQPGRGRPDHVGAAGVLPRTHRRTRRRQRRVARAVAHPQRGSGPSLRGQPSTVVDMPACRPPVARAGVGEEPCSSLYRLLVGRTRPDGRGFAPVAHLSRGPSMRPEPCAGRLPERRACSW